MINYLIGALVGLAYILYSSQSKPRTPGGVVQTAQVGDNLYTVTRIANHQYSIILTSVKGTPPSFPTYLLVENGEVRTAVGNEVERVKEDIPKLRKLVDLDT